MTAHEEPKTRPKGEIAKTKYVNRPWDAPSIDLPDIPKMSPPAAGAPES